MIMHADSVTFDRARFPVSRSYPSEVPFEGCMSKLEKLPDSDMARHKLVQSLDR